MKMKPSGRSILSAFKRAYAAQAQTARSSDKLNLTRQDPKVSKLGNGMIIASLENHGPVSQVALLVNAGPRYEPGNQLGITHCLRTAVGLTSEKTSQFGLTRNIQQLGANIGCTSTREHMIYTLDCLRDDVETGVTFLGEAVTRPSFLPWEVSELKDALKLDNSMYMEDTQARLMEAIHKTALRGGLENSLYCREHKIGWHTSDMLREYVSTHYSAGNMALVGLNVDHDQLTYLAKDMGIPNGTTPAATPSQYSAGQIRIDANSDLAHAIVMTQGVGMGSEDLLKFYVLQKVMGSGPSVKYGSNLASSKISKAVAKATNAPFAASCINASYSDIGMFGFQVVTHGSDMANALKSVAGTFSEATKGAFTDADVKRAKTQLQSAICMEMEDSSNFLLDFGIQALLSGQVLTAADIMTSIDQITTADINTVAKKVFNGKPSMAAIGDLSNTPHFDQIF